MVVTKSFAVEYSQTSVGLFFIDATSAKEAQEKADRIASIVVAERDRTKTVEGPAIVDYQVTVVEMERPNGEWVSLRPGE